MSTRHIYRNWTNILPIFLSNLHIGNEPTLDLPPQGSGLPYFINKINILVRDGSDQLQNINASKTPLPDDLLSPQTRCLLTRLSLPPPFSWTMFSCYLIIIYLIFAKKFQILMCIISLYQTNLKNKQFLNIHYTFVFAQCNYI